MGKIYRGVLGGFHGAVGNIVGSNWKGIDYMRIKPDSVANPKTEKQVAHRSKFSGVIRLAQSLMFPIIQPIWNKKAVKMSGYNLFVKTNLEAFDADGNVIDYGMLQLTTGKLIGADLSIAPTDGVASSVTVNWKNNTGQGNASADDKLRLLVIKEGETPLLLDDTAERSAETATIAIPFETGDTVHSYAFFEDVESQQFSVDSYQSVVLG